MSFMNLKISTFTQRTVRFMIRVIQKSSLLPCQCVKQTFQCLQPERLPGGQEVLSGQAIRDRNRNWNSHRSQIGSASPREDQEAQCPENGCIVKRQEKKERSKLVETIPGF